MAYRRFGWSGLKEQASSRCPHRNRGLDPDRRDGVQQLPHADGRRGLLKAATADLALSPLGVIILMQLSMLILGSIIDEMIIVIVCAPLYTPVAVAWASIRSGSVSS